MHIWFLKLSFLALVSSSFGQIVDEPVLVLPSITDKAINSFDTPHRVYYKASVKPRNKLVVFLPGTGGDGRGASIFNRTASDLGFHAISLSYPSSIPATVCQADADENCFENFRLEIITGEDKSPLISVDRANSIENRLQKVLLYLERTNKQQGWQKYLTDKGQINWEQVILTGQSQGGGHAPLIAKYHKVSRVLMFSAPKDYDVKNNRPALWYGEGSTPTDRFYSFVHQQDKQAGNYVQQLEILKKMGLYKYGEPTDVDKLAPPYGRSRILITNFPGTEISSGQAHISIVTDGTPKNSDGMPRFKSVWTYMLTAN